jgi:hypothetical protein
MSKINESSEEVRKIAIEKIAHVKIYQLNLIADVINLASTRGAFRGEELSHIGTLYDTLVSGVNKALELAKEDLDKVSEEPKPLTTIVEEEEEPKKSK